MKKQIRDALSEGAKGDAYGMKDYQNSGNTLWTCR